jgi:alpha-D-ribose 1-methylphosphonate 5-triphosphate synthase subunit PhnL
VGQLSVQVIGSQQRVVARGTASSWLILDADHPFCSSEADNYRVVVELPAGRDAGALRGDTPGVAYALQIWRLRL